MDRACEAHTGETHLEMEQDWRMCSQPHHSKRCLSNGLTPRALGAIARAGTSLTYRQPSPIGNPHLSKATGWSTIKKFDGKTYKAWAYHMKMLLNRERCKGIVDRTEVSPASPTKAVAAELDEDGKPIPGTGSAGAAPTHAFTDYTLRV
ncbi:hypothetical protein FN846DRAFT_889663 [Sphaerosporella brunnea]|uniref:Uncharacterized protein n=1 Tax=Sphaerosporella brunnea TaxID=1250544 RepID=A0A5J5EYH6_9PEZI|nr:hypothetical protein FN846DRAFT_889663 [Sphaerosporella brunnea]